MKAFLIGALTLLTLSVKSQHMNEVSELVSKLFIATDQKNWSEVENCFAEKLILDYSSMTGNPAAELTPQDISLAWKSILPGFEYTHHQLGNFQVNIVGKTAHVFCYGTATHFLTNDSGNLWTVVGSYDFDLAKNDKGDWKISSMKFNFKYQEGNTSLPERAMARLK